MVEWAFDELINMYEDALLDARHYYIRCCSNPEEDISIRRKNDEENFKKFVSICNKLRAQPE